MGRWESDAAGRMAEAALELFAQNGYEQTTAAQIAQRAGVTERTFFRHYTDKREVLFKGSEILLERMAAAVLAAPAAAGPLDVVALAVEAAAELLEERREFSKVRNAVIASSMELRERELIKMASLSAALADGLRNRGVKEPAASLAAETGVAVFRVSFERWVNQRGKRPFSYFVHESFDDLKAVTA